MRGALCVLCFLLALPLAAQTTAPGPPAVVDVTFHVMQVGRAEISGVRFSTAQAGSTLVEMQPHARTGPFHYRGANPVVFFRETAGPDGKPVREPVGTLRFNTSLKQALVFAIPRAPGATTGDPAVAGQAEIAFAAIDNSRAAFTPDSLVIYNALPMRVGAVLADRRIVVEPGATAPIPVGEFGRKTVPIEFWIETPGGPRMVLGSEIDFTRDQREVMILLPPRRAGSWLIQSVRVSEAMNTPPPPPSSSGR